jgi:membrane-bound inhibitor of C-type lysozyme
LPARFGRSDLVLGQVRAASGAKYEGDGVVVWTKGDEALLEVDGATYPGCRLGAADSPSGTGTP